ncbi:hypothetical protein ES703_125120 [subsurface metagenome]
MKIISAKIDDELYSVFQNYCQDRGSNINETLGGVIREVVTGKIKPAPTGLAGRIPLCPRCGFILFPNFGEGTLNCLRCGFYAQTPGPGGWQRGEFKID